MSQDPRFLRSQERLRAAVLELAAGRSAESITVAELCRAAGVTRDTFYRHAESPVALLVAALGERFEAAAVAHQDPAKAEQVWTLERRWPATVRRSLRRCCRYRLSGKRFSGTIDKWD